MFDIGWSELMVVGAIALIVVGPRDLPKLLHQFGKYTAHARRMAADFQRSMEDAAREADVSQMKEMRDTADQLRNLTRAPFAQVATPKAAPARTSAAAPTVAPAPVVEQAPVVAAAPAAAPAPQAAASGEQA